MEDRKIPILKKKVNINTSYQTITIVVAIALMVISIGGLTFGELYSEWKKTHAWQLPFRPLVREVEQNYTDEVISPVSGARVW